MKSSHYLTTSCLLLATICLASSQSNAPRNGQRRPQEIPLVTALDLDKDGALSSSELAKAPESLFSLDKNGDKKLTSEEMGAHSGGGERNGRRGGGGGGPKPSDLGESDLDLGEPGIAWYGRLDHGMEEAKRPNRPILFMAAASQCGGVPGVF